MRSRDRAFNTYLNTLTNIAPFLLAALGLAGYFFAGLAARPTEQGVLNLTPLHERRRSRARHSNRHHSS